MTSQLIHLIKQELASKRKLHLPGLGEVYLSRRPAKFSDDKSIIYPPEYQLLFQENTTYGPKLNGYKTELAKEIKSQLDSQGKAKINGFGVFIKENEKISFIPDKEIYKTFSSYEPIYGVQPIDKTFKGDVTNAVETQTLLTKKAAKEFNFPKWLKYLIYALLALGLLYALLFMPINLDDNSSEPKSVKKENKKVETQSGINKDTIPTASTLNNQSIAKTETNNLSENKVEKVIEEKNDIEKTDENRTTNYKKENINTPENNQSKNTIKNEIPTPVKRKKPRPRQDVNYALNPITGKPCAIITGAFASSTNTMKMIKKLQGMGYKVYTEELDSLTRVGVLYDCNDNPTNLLDKIRSSIEKNAWTLK